MYFNRVCPPLLYSLVVILHNWVCETGPCSSQSCDLYPLCDRRNGVVLIRLSLGCLFLRACLMLCLHALFLGCLLPWTTLRTKKWNYDTPTHTISFDGLVSSHDLVETLVLVIWLEYWMCSVQRGGCLLKKGRHLSGPYPLDAGSDAMWAAMRAKHGKGDAMQCKNPGDVLSRCGNPLRCAPTMRKH